MANDPLVYLIDPNEEDLQRTSRQLDEASLAFQSFCDANSFLAVLQPDRLGCVLTELTLGNSTALQLVNRIRQRDFSLPVALLTSRATVSLTVQAFKSGVFEVLEKPCKAFQIWDCVTRAFEYHSQEMEKARCRSSARQRIARLSRQELEVMQMLFDGMPNKRIATHLGVSMRTIVFRRKALMEKMNARSVGELACLVQVATGDQVDGFPTRSSSLLDVHHAAHLCEAAGEPSSPSSKLS